jgi:hypothetical protein
MNEKRAATASSTMNTQQNSSRSIFRSFVQAHIYAAKLAWDTVNYCSILVPLFIQNIVRNPTPKFYPLIRRYNDLHQRVQRLLIG